MSVKSGTAYLFAAALALSPSIASAASSGAVSPATQAPLAPGGAAGLQKAEMSSPSTAVWIAGAAVIVGGIVLIASSNGNGHGTPTTAAPGTH